MSSFDRQDKSDRRRGWAATLSVHGVLFILFSFFGLNYQDPPPEMGIPIDFGYEENGFGETPIAQSDTKSVLESTELEEIIPTITQDVIETIEINKKTKTPKPDVKIEKPVKVKPLIEKPKVASDLTNRLNSKFSNSPNKNNSTSSKGSSIDDGNQGKQDGNIINSGNGGSDVLGFSLGSRKGLTKLELNGNCGVRGDLYLYVWVGNDGIPYKIGAQSIKGTTITENIDCAIRTARELLKKARWEPDYSETYEQGIKIRQKIPFTL